MPNIFSKGTEDYLEAIYFLKKEKKMVRVKDIALELNVSLPSVSEKVKKLAGKKLVVYKKYEPVELTSKGKRIARKVYSKHKVLVDFFMRLGVGEKTALLDACKAEHVLSRKTINKMKIFVEKKKRRKK